MKKNTIISPLALTNNMKKITPKTKEWQARKKWNPFNSHKLLTHVQTWNLIKRGKPVPRPILITVDPTNVCNLKCEWCNAEFLRMKNKNSISRKALLKIADFLPRWGITDKYYETGVQAICVAGGGEPLLNPATGEFISRVIKNKIEVGVVSNGIFIDQNLDPLSKCTWVGVSIDAGTKKTYNQLKDYSPTSDSFNKVIANIAKLVKYSKDKKSKLGSDHPAYGVSYKYLLHKDNIKEVYRAAKLAKAIGCKNIHFRPAGTTWDKLGTERAIKFSPKDIEEFNKQISRAMKLDDEHFNVYGVTHKFSSQFEIDNDFAKCHSVFMTAVIGPPDGDTPSADAFNLSLCCDRRGDQKLNLAVNLNDPEKINQLWGSKKHWQIHDSIMVKNDCPRCTYQPHNQIYEQVIQNDSMTHKFI